MKRIPQLDGVRGLAILLVIFWHYGGCEFTGARGEFCWYANILLRLTWSGVDLFFVLSGFLIAGILLDHRQTSNYFRLFYLRRVCRILPLYACVVIAFVLVSRTRLGSAPAVTWLFHNPMPIWSYSTFTQNITMAERGTLGANAIDATWSLAVEEQFYLIIPFLIYFLSETALIATLTGLILIAPILRLFWPGVPAFVLTPFRSDSLLTGALLAVAVRSHSFVWFAREHRRSLTFGFLVFLAGAAGLTIHPPLLQGDAFTHLWLAGLYVCLILIAFIDAEAWLIRPLRWRIMIWLGQLSYGIYLIHKPAVGALFGIWRGTAPIIRTWSDAVLTLAAFALTLLLAVVSFRFFESPITRLGHSFLYTPKARANENY